MSWFGFGSGGSNNNNNNSNNNDHSSGNITSPYAELSNSSQGLGGFESAAQDHYSTPSSHSFAPSAASSGGFEQVLLQEQQRALLQAMMFKLTDVSFEMCVTKPSSSLSSSEKACIHAVTTKSLESAQFVVAAMSGQGGNH